MRNLPAATMKTKDVFALLIFVTLLFPPYGLAWDARDKEIHQQITRHAVVFNSGLHNYLQQNLGLTGGVATHLTKTGQDSTEKERILDWIAAGSRQEDEPIWRAFRHFHDPTRSWGWAGLG